MHQLKETELSQFCDPNLFDFETTDDISAPTTMIGQDRLTASVDFGINIKRNGYNIFVLGPDETDKRGHIQSFLESKVKDTSPPNDICYVNNFDDPYKPKALILPPGKGCRLKNKMDELLEDLIPTLNSTFETEEYQKRRQEVQEKLQEKQDGTFETIQEKAEEEGFSLIRTPSGFTFAPMKGEEIMEGVEIEKLSKEKRNELEEKTKELQKELQKMVQRMPTKKRKVREKLRELDQEVATEALEELFQELRLEFSDLENVQKFIDRVEKDIVHNVQAILESQQGSQKSLGSLLSGRGSSPSVTRKGGKSITTNELLQQYQVNVLVDHRKTEHAPIVYEDNPTYKNLIGRVEHESKMGNLTTDFSLIKPGSLHKANGGYLIIDARRLLFEPFAWEGLKRVLNVGLLKIESMGESYQLISTVSLEPEPIELDLKVVLLGERMLFYMLCQLEPDFHTFFKVEADFEDEIDRNNSNQELYAHLLAGLINKHGLQPFRKEAVSCLIDHSSRMVSDAEKLSTKTEEISKVLIEANYWAGQADSDIVRSEDVQKAIDQQEYRSSRLRDKVQEAINREIIFIDTDGKKIGQVNGLSVKMIGNLSFGQPTRITARVQLGKGEIINIEREVEMSGSIHSKGVLILKGFLGEMYAKDRPLSLSASLVFEQSYSRIDGDSASSAELYALLSAIGNIPIKQSLAVTGSVNQHGIVQPIGGVNEKIEGFFDVCEKRGLTGTQGVLIPKANEKNLMLKKRVRSAVKENKFHIYSISTIEEGMALLADMKMGEKDKEGNYPEGTVNYRVMESLDQMAQARKSFSSVTDGESS